MEAFLQYVESYLPEKKLTNEQISLEHPEWDVEKIALKTGISSRNIAAENETSLDLGYNAAKKLLDKYNVSDKIDYLLFCTQTPDYFLPTSACVLQNRLGLRQNIGALDFNLGCSGYIYGLGLAKGLIMSGQAKNILLITGETYSKLIHKDDKSNKTIFGDAGTATLLTSYEIEGALNAQIGSFDYATDGGGEDFLIVKNGGFRNSNNIGNQELDENNQFYRNDNHLFMNGKEIFNFTANKVPLLLNENLKSNNENLEDIDLFIFHQANSFMLNFIRNKCKIPSEKFFIDIKDIGNTVSNTIPLAIEKANKLNTFKDSNKILLCGFGVGLSMGAVTLYIK
jgi:3-oxoacyl-[acyl-carrier-protein] synthase-3